MCIMVFALGALHAAALVGTQGEFLRALLCYFINDLLRSTLRASRYVFHPHVGHARRATRVLLAAAEILAQLRCEKDILEEDGGREGGAACPSAGGRPRRTH